MHTLSILANNISTYSIYHKLSKLEFRNILNPTCELYIYERQVTLHVASKAQNDVERWLIHEGLRFRYAKKMPEESFKLIISNPDGRDDGTEVFEPAKQPGVIVVGRKCPYTWSQNARFQNMTQSERDAAEARIEDYCQYLGVVHRFLTEDGLRMVGVYVVLDAENMQNQEGFSDALRAVAEAKDTLKDRLRRTF